MIRIAGIWLRGLALAALGAALVSAVVGLPDRAPGLAPLVRANLAASGVDNPVTAVLLNYRGYDTLLEITVMAMAIIGVWSLAEMPRQRLAAPSLVLRFLVQVFVPFLVLLSGYLLWAGSHEPGGAFQAGAVLAAAGVLMILSGAPLPDHLSHWPLRALLILGPVTFAAAGAAMMLLAGGFLVLPTPWAKHLILLIEAAATVSIAVTLVSAFRGGRPPDGAR